MSEKPLSADPRFAVIAAWLDEGHETGRLEYAELLKRLDAALPPAQPHPDLVAALTDEDASDALKRASLDEVFEALVFAILDGTFQTEDAVRHALQELVYKTSDDSWPRPDDFRRMTPDEFEAYIERTGFAARIEAARREPILTEQEKAAIWDAVDGHDSNYGRLIGPREQAVIDARTGSAVYANAESQPASPTIDPPYGGPK